MTEKRQWTEEQDRLLKEVFESSGLTKWSHIARKLQEEHGVKGRNGKQCKQRYITSISTTPLKEEWSYSDEQRMLDLHNELGNKWAIIGTKLDARSDNCVKNHFYSKLRRALRKINKVIQTSYKKEIKEFKPNVLYRIVEVAQENFKMVPSYEKIFSSFSSQLKNQLFQFSYDDEVEQKNQEIEFDNINVEQANELIDKLIEFVSNYKKKAKKQRKCSDQGQQILAPHRFAAARKCSSQHEESELGSSNKLSDASNLDDISDDEAGRAKQAKKPRKASETCSAIELANDRMRTRANSHGSKEHSTQSTIQSEMKDEQGEDKAKRESLELQDALGGLHILEQDDILPPHLLMMKKESSRYSRASDHFIEREEFHFFEDSQIEMRILPEMDFGFHRDSQFEENIFM